ncbi:GNAT family N-acetyltransferase [Senegalia sp. (in: firmicutes)]|uniref:GNAT family N-acetyltransferase n=1 Tax=Senegalia sp. (in: firmicutes) TaxID=1924098 RepID=UPI003F9C5165
MELRVVPFTKNDLDDIVKTHIQCFPESFSSELGSGFLKYMYLFSIEDKYSINLLVKDESNKVIGFVDGTCKPNGYNSRLLDKYKYRLIFNAVKKCILKPSLINKLISQKMGKIARFMGISPKIKNKIDYFHHIEGKCSSIKSICVAPQYKGKNIAKLLFNKFEIKSTEVGCEYLILSVKKENIRAVNFYKKMGMDLHWQGINTEGTYSQGYFKKLGEIK